MSDDGVGADRDDGACCWCASFLPDEGFVVAVGMVGGFGGGVD